MTNFWIAVCLISIFSAIFIYFTVVAGTAGSQEDKELIKSQGGWSWVLPLAFLLATPGLYLIGDSYQKQLDWHNVVNKTETLKGEGDISSVELSMQELILGLRTQAHHNPDNGQLWYELGAAYTRLQMNDAALASWQRATRLENNPDWIVASAQLLAAGQSSEDAQQAIGLLQQVLASYPEHQSGLLTLGFTYFKISNYELAIATWQKLADLDSISPQSRQFIQQQIDDARQRISHSNSG